MESGLRDWFRRLRRSCWGSHFTLVWKKHHVTVTRWACLTHCRRGGGGGGGSGSLMFLLVGVIISSLFPLFTSSLCVSCVKKTNSAVQWKSMHVCESSAASERNTSRRCTRTIDFSTVSGPSNTCGPTTRPPTPTVVWVLWPLPYFLDSEHSLFLKDFGGFLCV